MKKQPKLVVTLTLTVLIIALSACSAPTISISPSPTFIPTHTPIATPSFTPAPPPTPIGGGSGKIAVISSAGNGIEVYVMNADGSGETKLTNYKTATGGPAWSP